MGYRGVYYRGMLLNKSRGGYWGGGGAILMTIALMLQISFIKRAQGTLEWGGHRPDLSLQYYLITPVWDY